jgi:uncharacterized protein (TIGR01244 family)
MIVHRLTDRFTVSDAPTEDELRTLARQGFRSIIDLRGDGEPRPRGVAPWKEARLAADIGLAYRQIPVEPTRLGNRLGDLIRQAVRKATPPILLHCTTGRRAGLCGLLVIACDERLTVASCLDRGRAIGLFSTGSALRGPCGSRGRNSTTGRESRGRTLEGGAE